MSESPIRRGAPAKCNNADLIALILDNKDKIVLKNNKILSKNDELWMELSNMCKIKNTTLYTYVTNNIFGIRDALFRDKISSDEQEDELEVTNNSLPNISFKCPDEFSFVMSKGQFLFLMLLI